MLSFWCCNNSSAWSGCSFMHIAASCIKRGYVVWRVQLLHPITSNMKRMYNLAFINTNLMGFYRNANVSLQKEGRWNNWPLSLPVKQGVGIIRIAWRIILFLLKQNDSFQEEKVNQNFWFANQKFWLTNYKFWLANQNLWLTFLTRINRKVFCYYRRMLLDGGQYSCECIQILRFAQDDTERDARATWRGCSGWYLNAQEMSMMAEVHSEKQASSLQPLDDESEWRWW